MIKVKVNLPGVGEVELLSPYDDATLPTQIEEIFISKHYGAPNKNVDVVVDVGGNIGLSAIYFSQFAKKVYVCEPNPNYFQCLVENIKNFPNIIPINIALSHMDSKQFLITNDGGEQPESLFGNGEKGIEVETVTIGTLLERIEVDIVDILKLDCEGAEYLIVMSKSFNEVKTRIKSVVGESHTFQSFEPNLLIYVFQSLGFRAKILPFENMFKSISFVKDKEYMFFEDFLYPDKTIFKASR